MRWFASAVVVSLIVVVPAHAAAHRVAPQATCPTYFNWTQTSYTAANITFTWDPAPNAPAGSVYEILRGSGPDYCSIGNYSVIATTTTTSYTTTGAALYPQPNLAWGTYIRLQSDTCYASRYTLVDDTFTAAPTKPPVPQLTVGNGTVTATFTYNDTHTFGVDLYRTDSTGRTSFAGFAGTCSPAGTLTIVDYGPGGSSSAGGKLTNGVYTYRLEVANNYLFGQHLVVSDSASAVVGPPIALSINSFTASPPTIRLGQSATLSWSTQGTAGVLIDKLTGTFPSSGSVTVKPTTTTTYTLTAMQGASTVTASVTVEVVTAPLINVTSFPAPMLQPAGTGGATTTYALTNSGGAASSITLSANGTFFTQTPASFTLQPGGTQVVTITGTSAPAGSYEGASVPSGSGVPSGLQIPVKLLSAAPPSGTVTADASSNRVDVAATSATNPTGSVSFTNHGTATLSGILSSDVPWIIPQSGVVTIAPGQTVSLSFTIDRSKRADASALVGSAEGSFALNFLTGGGSPFAKRPLDTTPAVPSVSLVKVVDTVQPAVSVGGIPGLTAGEVALFISGVGHTVGTKGSLFVSDVSILNPQGAKAIDDVKLYYTPLSGSPSSAKSTSLPSVASQVTVAVADVVKNVFNGNDEVGSLQIRSKDAAKLAVAATVMTTNNPSGAFGNTIPVLRSDRAIDVNGTVVLSGLRKDATTHTNLYIQEMAGAAATVKTEFLAADGTTIGARPSDSIDAFKMLRLFDVVPANAVAAIITNTSTAGGKIAAYATPFDEASTDTWAIADWSEQLGYAAGDATVIPIAGSVHGANNTFYRTDVAITNRGSASASGTLRYISRAGDKIDKQVSLGARQTNVLNDIVGTFFNVTGDSLGYVTFTPVTGSFAVTSRTFTTTAAKPDTFGAAVATLAAASALPSGSSRGIAGLNDAARTTVVAARPGTFRTNFGLMETTGQSVVVRVTFRFTFPAGAKASGIGSAYRDYTLNANQFLLLNSLAGEILGPDRLQFGDLTNAAVDFQILSGKGSIVLFTSSVDNGTGDSIVRTD